MQVKEQPRSQVIPLQIPETRLAKEFAKDCNVHAYTIILFFGILFLRLRCGFLPVTTKEKILNFSITFPRDDSLEEILTLLNSIPLLEYRSMRSINT